jgi:hypothetical protein
MNAVLVEPAGANVFSRGEREAAARLYRLFVVFMTPQIQPFQLPVTNTTAIFGEGT